MAEELVENNILPLNFDGYEKGMVGGGGREAVEV